MTFLDTFERMEAKLKADPPPPHIAEERRTGHKALRSWEPAPQEIAELSDLQRIGAKLSLLNDMISLLRNYKSHLDRPDTKPVPRAEYSFMYHNLIAIVRQVARDFDADISKELKELERDQQ